MLIFVLGPSIFVNVSVRECMVLNVCEATCESVWPGANILMNVGGRERGLVECANVLVDMYVWVKGCLLMSVFVKVFVNEFVKQCDS
jgi:hypothetical protein